MLNFLFSTNIILIITAVVPAIVLLIVIYKADKRDKEPPRLLIGLVALGIISTSLAVVTERIGNSLLLLFCEEDSLLYNALMYFVVVALSEEGFKYLLLKFRTWNNPNFNCQFDGVVYAVFVSLGFALWENIGYVLSFGLNTALVRAITAVPGHACFGVFMGLFYGIAKKYSNLGDERKSKGFRTLAVVIPALLHGTYNFTASLENQHFAWIFFAFVAVLFVVAIIMVRKLSKSDKYLYKAPQYEVFDRGESQTQSKEEFVSHANDIYKD